MVAIGGWRSIELQMNQLVRKEIDLCGTFNYTTDEFEQACQWLVDGRFEIDSLQCIGFGFDVEPDFAAMQSPEEWQFASLGL